MGRNRRYPFDQFNNQTVPNDSFDYLSWVFKTTSFDIMNNHAPNTATGPPRIIRLKPAIAFNSYPPLRGNISKIPKNTISPPTISNNTPTTFSIEI